MEYKSADSISGEFVSTDLDILSVALAKNVVESRNNDIHKECPLCKAAVRYFILNLNEKVLMCENQDCEYPYGHEELQFAKLDEICHTEDEGDSIPTIMTSQLPSGASDSITSTNGWFDFEKLNKAYGLENSQKKTNVQDEIMVDSEAALDSLKERKAEIETKGTVQQIKKLKNKLQKSYQTEQVSCIKTKEWVKHLRKLQGQSPGELLKKEEISRMGADEAELAPGQLAIGIDSSSMYWLSAICVLAVAVHGGGGVTKTADLSPFWTDDYKVFEQIYGRTSDRELYGSTLPPSLSFGIDLTALQKQASEKKERFVDTGDSDVLEPQASLYSFGDQFDQLLTKQSLEAFEKPKPTKQSFKFIPYNDFTPISQANDPETYNYYKTLEFLDKKKKLDALRSLGSVRQVSNYEPTNPEDTEGYKSIQDILEAHEGNRGNKKQNTDHENLAKYVSYGVSKSRRKKPGPSSRYIQSNELPKPRCVSGRCRKRTNSVRVRSGPVLRKIKHTIISD